MSHIYAKEMQIHGDSVNTEVFVDAGGSEWIRFMTEGCWGPQTVSDTDASIQVCVNGDGSISAVMQKLIPIEKASNVKTVEQRTVSVKMITLSQPFPKCFSGKWKCTRFPKTNGFHPY